MIIEENGKQYHIDEETGLVTEASVVTEPDVVVEEMQNEFRIGDRVSINDELGTVISIIGSVYGPAIGVRFDDQSIDEFSEEQLSHVDIPAPDYETPVKEVIERYAAYQELPIYTSDEIETKTQEGRWLNLRAKSLITDTKLPLGDQVELDKIVLATGTDLLDLKHLASVEDDEYAEKLTTNRWSIGDQFLSRASMGTSEDASWVSGALEDMETTTDEDLAKRAQEMVSLLPEDKLEDEAFVALASSYQEEYLFVTEEQAEKFKELVKHAIEFRQQELNTKVASTEEPDDLDDFDTSSLYI
jgi:hypothetical protein